MYLRRMFPELHISNNKVKWMSSLENNDILLWYLFNDEQVFQKVPPLFWNDHQGS